MSLKHNSCPPCPMHLPRGWNCKRWWNGKAIFLHTGRYNCEWLLLHNFALMQLQNLHHFSNWWNKSLLNTILHTLMCTLMFFSGLATSDITVTPSVMCMDWLFRWYHQVAHLVSSSVALAFLNNRREKRKSTSLSAIQVKNWWKTIASDEKLEATSPPKKGWMKCHIHCNVKLAHSSPLTVCDNVCRIKKRLGLKIFHAIRLPHSFQNWPYQKSRMWASYLFNATQIYAYIVLKYTYIVYKCIDYIYTPWFSHVH